MSALDEIHSEFTRIVNEIAGIPVESIEPDKHFVHDLGIDSLSMAEIMVAAEEQFGVRILDKVDDLPTVNDVAAYIRLGQG